MGRKTNTACTSSAYRSRYSTFAQINGNHPYRQQVRDGYVDYNVRSRHSGEVFFFNFELAKEMGLIPADHPETLNKELTDTLLYTFSIVIINEYDIEHNIRFQKKDIRPYKYMATRYLQLQHPDRRGLTSGDGRSIWNGYYRNNNTIWDISSCGTGATSLSPATAIEGKYFKTGDRYVSYGCGRADLLDGLGAAINSEIFHYNGIKTERTLAIIKYRDGSAINVRAAHNLVRPAHLFRYLKQNDYHGLKNITDYYIGRQIKNGAWPSHNTDREKYQYLLERITRDFARLAAKFESDYVFCWLDWDGDNIMMDGSIVDYGSIRQFGMFHREYRYDDVERMSTTIAGQKHQAKYIVQTFCQAVDFLLSGRKKNLNSFRQHASLKAFDRIFIQEKYRYLLYKIGFDTGQIEKLSEISAFNRATEDFYKVFCYFERIQSSGGVYRVSDGITSDAVFCMRDLLRELPAIYLKGSEFVSCDDFIKIIRSEYAIEEDIRLHSGRKRKIRRYQQYYRELIRLAAEYLSLSEQTLLKKIARRSALINRYDRVTGDAIIVVAGKMVRLYKELGANESYRILRHFIAREVLLPEQARGSVITPPPLRKPRSKMILRSMLKIVGETRYGI